MPICSNCHRFFDKLIRCDYCGNLICLECRGNGFCPICNSELGGEIQSFRRISISMEESGLNITRRIKEIFHGKRLPYTFTFKRKIFQPFSQREIIDLFMATMVLSFAFTIAFRKMTFPSFLFSFIAVVTGFVFHELAHKFSARKFGLWAEFRASFTGLLLAIITAALGLIIIAAPGAVVIFQPASREEYGVIASSGCLMNIVASCLFKLASFSVGGLLFERIAIVNAYLALFNLLPILGLDGSKVIVWNKKIWFLLILASSLLLFSFFI